MRECILAYDEDYLIGNIDEEYFGVWLFLVMTTISWDVVTNLKKSLILLSAHEMCCVK